MTNLFTQRLMRLKLSTGLSLDREIAAFLGISNQALNERKRRDSFPVDRLHTVASQRPDLGIDVEFVMNGGPARLPQCSRQLPCGTPALEVILGVVKRYEAGTPEQQMQSACAIYRHHLRRELAHLHEEMLSMGMTQQADGTWKEPA